MVEKIKIAFFNSDINVFYFINGRIKCKVLDKIMPIFTRLGNASITIVICLTMIMLGKSLMKLAGIEAIIALTISHIFIQLLKKTVCRARPNMALENINTFNVPIDFYSFPSGHTTAIFSITTVFSIYYPIMAVPLLIIAFTVGLSRLYLGVHYPSDVGVGLFIGTLFAFVVHLII